jgi:hypothetical protein
MSTPGACQVSVPHFLKNLGAETATSCKGTLTLLMHHIQGLSSSAAVFSPFLGNAGKANPDQIILDGPFFLHLPKVTLWAAFQGILIADIVLRLRGVHGSRRCISLQLLILLLHEAFRVICQSII